jgi:hypothetical protein
MKMSYNNIKKAAIKYEKDNSCNHERNAKIAIINAYIAGAKSVTYNIPPTHYRFKSAHDAARWGCTTKEWLHIESIQHGDISTYDFAWVLISQLEFKTNKPTMCRTCHENPVTRIGDECPSCDQNKII